MITAVLLVNQDIAFIVSLKQALERTNEFKVALAANPDAAADVLRRARFDIAVVDFEVAGYDAMEIIRILRKVQPDLPILMTAENDVQRERTEYLDVQGAIMKPFGSRDLIPRLRRVLQYLEEGKTPRPRVPRDTGPLRDPQAPPDLVPPDDSDAVDRASALDMLNAALEDAGDDEFDLDRLAQQPPQTGPLQQSDADVLEEFEALEAAATGSPGAQENAPARPDPDGTRLLPDIDEQTGFTDLLDEHADPDPDGTRLLPDLDAAHDPEGTRLFDDEDQAEDRDRTRLLDMDDEPPDTTALLQWDADPEPTRSLRSTDRLDTSPDPDGTQALPDLDLSADPDDSTATLEWADPDDAGRDPDEQEEGLTRERWELGTPKRDTKRLRRDPLGGPPRTTDEMDALSEDDLAALEGYGDDDFDDVLDAVAEAGDPDDEDDEFHTLVESMRRPEQARPPRSRLEALIDSIAEDAVHDVAAPDSPADAVDYVLDAIRRGRSPRPPVAPDVDDHDATIGDVIDGLFDPEFEGVLAALSGEEIDEDDYDEPTYASTDDPDIAEAESFTEAEDGADYEGRAAAESVERDTGSFDDWAASADATYFTPDEKAFVEEPPVTPEDSSRYPATTVLAATSEEIDEFSLDELLQEIEDQLPPVRTRRPRLRPLPSWEREGHLEGSGALASMFDYAEGVRQEPLSDEELEDAATTSGPAVFTEDVEITPPDAALPDEAAPPRDSRIRRIKAARPSPRSPAPRAEEPVDLADEPPIYEGDTIPSAALRAEMEGYDAQETDTVPLEPPTDEDLIPLPDDITPPEFDASAEVFGVDRGADMPDEEDALLSIDELLARADLPPEAGEDEIRRDRDRHSAPGVLASDEGDFDAADLGIPIEPASDDEIAAAFYDGVREDATGPQEAVSAPVEDDMPAYPPDFIERVVEPAVEDEDTARFANLDDEVAAEYAAGAFGPRPDEAHLVSMPVDEATQRLEAFIADEEEQDDEEELARLAVQLTQYSLESSAQAIMLSRGGDLLADAGDLDEDTIEVLFEAVAEAWRSRTDSESLMRFISVPEVGDFLLYSAALAGDMRLSMVFHADTPVRTIRRQARRMGESLALIPPPAEDDAAPAAATTPSRPTDLRAPAGLRGGEGQRRARKEDEPRTTYTALWLPRDPGQELTGDLADALYEWIGDVADDRAWDLQQVTIHEDYVALTLSAPQKLSPDRVITHLMDETAARVAEEFPGAGNGKPLWTDGYFVVTPPRDLNERDISRIITVQRNAQIER